MAGERQEIKVDKRASDTYKWDLVRVCLAETVGVEKEEHML